MEGFFNGENLSVRFLVARMGNYMTKVDIFFDPSHSLACYVIYLTHSFDYIEFLRDKFMDLSKNFLANWKYCKLVRYDGFVDFSKPNLVDLKLNLDSRFYNVEEQ